MQIRHPRTKITLLVILVVALVLLLAYCTLTDGRIDISDTFTAGSTTEEATKTAEPNPTSSATSEIPTSEPTATADATETSEPTAEPSKTAEAYVSPIDFASLKAINEDIYAWIEIPGIPNGYAIPNFKFAFPIVQHPTDNSFYVRRNIYKQWDVFGCIFTENYNSTSFDDPVTVVYGHTTGNWTMFGPLQGTYSNSKYFYSDDSNKIHVYLPDKELTYQIFAAVEYSPIHILYYYNFENEIVYDAFFNDAINQRTISSNVDKSSKPKYGDKVLILSTCLYSTSDRRFLVMAKLIETD